MSEPPKFRARQVKGREVVPLEETHLLDQWGPSVSELTGDPTWGNAESVDAINKAREAAERLDENTAPASSRQVDELGPGAASPDTEDGTDGTGVPPPRSRWSRFTDWISTPDTKGATMPTTRKQRTKGVRYDLRDSRGKQPVYFRIVRNGNNKVLASSEQYAEVADARTAIRLIDRKAEIVDLRKSARK